MTNSRAYEQYKENSVYTARPEELTLMLYNGIIKFIMQSENSIGKKEIEKAHKYNIKAQDIITELIITLDKRYEISKNFMLMYDYMKRRLVDANAKKSVAILQEVLELAKDLRDTWAKAMKDARTKGSHREERLQATV